MVKNNLGIFISVPARLLRTRLSLMVTFSAMSGYLLTGSSHIGDLIFLATGVFFMAAGTSALNQVQEYRLDARMKRTLGRPIPSGEISIRKSLLIASVLIFGGTLFLSSNGWLPMALGLTNILFYNLIYTPLKTRSWLAIVPGALVGAVPPLIGWTSAGYELFHPRILFVASFVFLWQIPHFWMLMIKYGKEYELAGFSSISKILNQRQIKSVTFGWAVITSLFLMMFPLFGIILSQTELGFFIAINLMFITLFYRLLFKGNIIKTIGKAFILINTFALVVFLFLVINALVP